MDTIVNRVKESGLIQLDMADFKPNVELIEIDITDQLWQGLVLKEKDFRAWIKTNDWTQYHGKAVFIHCSADAIIPTWAYMLIASNLQSEDVPYVVGSHEDLFEYLLLARINQLNLDAFKDARVIIKGCADIPNPAFAMTELLRVLQSVTKSVMYGEPCSTVPVFKRR